MTNGKGASQETPAQTYVGCGEQGRTGQRGGGPHHGSGCTVRLGRAEGVQARVGAQAALRVTAVAAGRGGWKVQVVHGGWGRGSRFHPSESSDTGRGDG